jgi:hypothetical protein
VKPTDVSSGLTVERLHSLLDYDAETGIFRWKVRRGSVVAGAIAGSRRKDGYYGVQIDGREYLLHRLAWFYVKGRWPMPEADHRDLDKGNNRLANLREATQSQNRANVRVRTKSGFKGVYIYGGRDRPFQAAIRIDGKQNTLGYFASAEEAHEVYKAAAAKAFGEFARAA